MGLLADKVVMISGAASEIGRATAIKVAQEGACLALLDSNSEGLSDTCQHLPADSQVRTFHMNLRQESAWQNALADTLNEFQRLDGLVNCEATPTQAGIKDMSLTTFQEALATNLEGAFLGLKLGYQAMKTNPNGGAIVNVSSVFGQLGMPGYCAYSAATGGTRLMTKAAAIEFGMANTNIRVNSVHPGALQSQFAESIPAGRIATPEDVANSIAFLLYDGAKFMTGSEVTVDGGWSCQLPPTAESAGGTQ